MYPLVLIIYTSVVFARRSAKQVDGEMNEQCDSRLFLLDLEDPNGKWREGASFPGECGLGQTMNTVKIPRDEEEEVS